MGFAWIVTWVGVRTVGKSGALGSRRKGLVLIKGIGREGWGRGM